MCVIRTDLLLMKSGLSPCVCDRKYGVWLHVFETSFPENGHVKRVGSCWSNNKLLSV